ncbi:MAG: acetylornithine deacetylase [Rhizobiales bacterium]|nr:acetylornithine deacetylase [Hyphomicrobiales bacterium]
MSTIEAISILERLVAFDTTSRNSNLALLAYVEGLLGAHGIESRRIPDPSGQKASLFATIAAHDGGTEGGIGLSGHTDVVPVDGQNWSTDPFRLTERDGRLYGRGACDMKGYLACILASLPEFKRKPLARPIHLLFSYDEEVGCTGVRPMIDLIGKSLPRPDAILVGEPSSMRVIDAHKGATRFQTRVTGREAHSSMSHLGVNAIQYAARAIAGIMEIERELAELAPSPRFTPAYTTLHVGLIEGGTAMNIVPKTCTFSWEARPVPGVSARGDVLARFEANVAAPLVERMRRIDPEAGIATVVSNDIPAFDGGSDGPGVALARALTGENDMRVVSFMTEAALFQLAGLSSAVCGPGDIAQAHAPDEFIAIGELERCMGTLERLAASLRL